MWRAVLTQRADNEVGSENRPIRCQGVFDSLTQETVTLTVQEQLARAEANELFKQGRLDLAAEAYEKAFSVTVLSSFMGTGQTAYASHQRSRCGGYLHGSSRMDWTCL